MDEHTLSTTEAADVPSLTTVGVQLTPGPTAEYGDSTLAVITTRWLEDNAISLNHRQYPPAAVNQLIRSAQEKLADPQGLPLTCYVSHEKAEEDQALDIVGKITRVWKEGAQAYATIEVPNTRAGHDIVALVKGGFIRSQSLRASGAQLVHSSASQYPQVTGPLSLDGIDFTTRPGLEQIARITNIQVVSEAAEYVSLTDSFTAETPVHTEQAASETTKDTQEKENRLLAMNEEHIAPLTSGETPGMTPGAPSNDTSLYAKSTAIPMTSDSVGNAVSIVSAHDRLAYVLGLECAPSTMEAATFELHGKILEKGAKLSADTRKHLIKAHNALSEALGKGCATSDPDSMSASTEPPMTMANPSESVSADTHTQKDTNTMTTTEEAIALLKQSGFSVTPPKTREEELQEALDRRLQEQAERFEAQQATLLAKIEEMGKQVTEASNPFARAQRKSLVEATAQEPSHRPYYRNGDYIREHLNDQSFREGLLDRSRPLPDNINPEHLLRELQLELLGMYDATYGLTGNPRIVAL